MCGSMEHLLGSFPRENHITWQVMETFTDDPNVYTTYILYKVIRLVDMRGQIYICLAVLSY